VKPVVGLIGGMGSGKSQVGRELARRGARVIVADQLGHEALRDPDTRAAVVRHFGTGVLKDGSDEIDRRKVGAIVFTDPEQRRALESLVFPWIERRIREELDAAQADPAVRLVVLDAAILLEAGWNRVCDRLVYVHAPRALRLRRLKEQRGWSEEEVEARERAQFPLTDKAARADHVIDNAGALDELARQVDHLWRCWGMDSQP
jgi:dephospho-CoA kinase